jgi:cystathionine beta-synthase
MHRDVEELIGRTSTFVYPVSNGASLFLKLEKENAGGSMKSRTAKHLLSVAEKEGRIHSGGTVIDCSSGSYGIGLAMLAAAKGYKCICVVADDTPPQIISEIRAYGASLIECPVPANQDSHEVLHAKATEITRIESNIYYLDQFHSQKNAESYLPLVQEIKRDIGDQIDGIIGYLGTGGSVGGTATFLKKEIKHLQAIGVQYGNADTNDANEDVSEFQGVDCIDSVTLPDSYNTVRTIARRMGILLGPSSGAVILAALRRIEIDAQQRIVALLCDGGERYLDTIHSDEWMEDFHLHDADVVNYIERMSKFSR